MSRVYADPAVGQRFGRWTVLSLPSQDKKRLVQVRCDCGNESVTWFRDMANGRSTQCKTCANRAQVGHQRTRRHGESKTGQLYNAWTQMRRRCSDPPGGPYYNGWSGRGVTVEPVWGLYENFRDWSLAHGFRPNAGLSLDRIDNDGNYGPDNCRWADMKTQSRNRRSNRQLTALGETKTVIEWIEDPRVVVSAVTARSRLADGWDAEAALFTPRRKYQRRAP